MNEDSLKPIRLISNSKGSLLIAALIFTALIGILLTTAWEIVSSKQEGMLRVRALNSRDAVLNAAFHRSRVATFFYHTILNNDPANQAFINCLMVTGPNNCVAKNASGVRVDIPMTLYEQTSPGTYRIVIGSSQASPVAYSILGEPCASSSADCPFSVYSRVQAFCPSDTDTCDQADTMKVTVTTEVASAYQNLFPSMSPISASQTLGIGNYRDFYTPILPPNVIDNSGVHIGVPVTSGAGPGGWFVTQSTPPPSGPVPPPPPPPPPPPGPPGMSATCATGQIAKLVSGTTTCVTFSF